MKRLLWPGLLALLGLTLAVGTIDNEASAPSAKARGEALANELRCPTCAGLSVADSTTPLAVSSRQEIDRRIAAGESDQQIRDYFVSRYGAQALLSPPSEGVAGLVWALPAGAAVLAAVAVALALKRWRMRSSFHRAPTLEEQELVRRALEKQ